MEIPKNTVSCIVYWTWLPSIWRTPGDVWIIVNLHLWTRLSGAVTLTSIAWRLLHLKEVSTSYHDHRTGQGPYALQWCIWEYLWRRHPKEEWFPDGPDGTTMSKGGEAHVIMLLLSLCLFQWWLCILSPCSHPPQHSVGLWGMFWVCQWVLCPKSANMSCPTRRRVPRSDPDHPARRMRMRCRALLQIMCPVMRRCLTVTPLLGRMIMTGQDPLVRKSARMIQIGILTRNPASLMLLVLTENRVDLLSRKS